jgi:hypothetical protein
LYFLAVNLLLRGVENHKKAPIYGTAPLCGIFDTRGSTLIRLLLAFLDLTPLPGVQSPFP